MRLLIILFLLPVLGFFSTPAWAQNTDPAVYEITDVAADVTADSAAHARDQALIQAQRSAYQQLLQRLGTDSSMATKMSDDDIGALVQSFEVQNERSSAVRYIGTFTIQFKPNAVRALLGDRSATFTDTRSKPVVVLPVYISGGHPVLWEENTKWRAAWESGSHSGGLVPIVVPQGGLDDIAVISTEEAVSGKEAALKAIIDKYQAGSALVAVLDGDPSKPGTELRVELWHYDEDGDASPPGELSLPVPADKNGGDIILAQAVRQGRAQLEKDWKQAVKSGSAPATDANTGDETPVSVASGPPSTHLPVTVPIATLDEWAQIEQRLNRVPNISRAEIITLARGMTSIELEFQGNTTDLQAALMQQNLSLTQDPANSTWILQPLAIGGKL